MRVIAGRYRGVPLATSRSPRLRPTTDRVKEAMFGTLYSMGVLEGGRCLELFAGTGSLGIEALSRGLDHVTFVEADRALAALVEKNLRTIKAPSSSSTIIEGSLPRALRRLEGATFDLVLMDPPYDEGLVATTLAALVQQDVVAPGSVVVVQHHVREALTPPPPLEEVRRRAYGDTIVTYCAYPTEESR